MKYVRTLLPITALAALLLLGPVGCEVEHGDDFAQSERGQSCTRTADCTSGLACVQGMCTLDEFPISQTARACTLVECQQASECCAPDATACEANLLDCTEGDLGGCTDYVRDCTCRSETATCDDHRCGQACSADAHCCPDVPQDTCDDLRDLCDEGDFASCEARSALQCNCDPADFRCTAGTCAPRCSEDFECGPGNFCVDGACVDCQADEDCPEGAQCVDATCIEPCENNTDCGPFEACNTATGRCDDVGCQTNRECVAWHQNVLATCNQGTCEIPCESDNDCDDAFSYGHQKCVSGVCEFIGCETNEECKLFSGAFGPGVDGDWQCMAIQP